MQKIIFYQSLEEAEMARLRRIISEDPRIRLKKAVDLIRKVYADREIVSKKEKILYFP